jgi:Ca2+-binding EF-hand superfamily protein
LDPANFKTCLLKLKTSLKITIGEINRLGRYIPKNDYGLINYSEFLQTLDKEFIKCTLRSVGNYNHETKFTLPKFAQCIISYLQKYSLSIRLFLRRVMGLSEETTEEEMQYQKLSVTQGAFFAFVKDYLVNNHTNESKMVTAERIKEHCERVDIDKDGMVDFHDLTTFLKRHDFIESVTKRLIETVKTSYGFDLGQKMKSSAEMNLFPTQPLDDSKVGTILRDLRNSLIARNISYHEFFSKLDHNKDGLITFNEFEDGMKTVSDFSAGVLKGLFAFFDRQKIGMIDFKTFLQCVKKTVFGKFEDIKGKDNFEWQGDVINMIRTWYKGLQMTSEDAFRIIDIDYDQEINKTDLHRFLKDVLKIPAEELNSSRIDRLYNLMDLYRIGKVTYVDFKRILSETDDQPCESKIVTGGRPNEKLSFDWKLKARQQIGYHIDRNGGISESFDAVANNTITITFMKFKDWLEKGQVLQGFNLTDKLIQELFSD